MRIAEVRRQTGLTLAATAARAGLSPAYLSQIESGSANPTLRRLAQLAAALGVELAGLFGAGTAERDFAPYYSPSARAITVDGMAGVWDRTAVGSARLTARLVHGDAGDHAEPVTHAGEEYVVVVRGRCRLHVDGTAHDLGEGDSCHYDARSPHHVSAATSDLTLSVVMSGHGTMSA